MKAARITAPGNVEMADVPAVQPEKGQVLVRMVVGAICGSDLHHLREHYPKEAYPLRPGYSGHECAGIVEIGDGRRFRPGDRVLVLPPDYNGFAEMVACAPRWLLRLPDEIPWKEAVLAQQLGTVLYCVRRLGSVVGADVVVLGQGPAGLLFDQWFRVHGARSVTGIDVVPHRLEIAEAMGATHRINASRTDAAQAIRRRLPGGADIVVEAVGKPETLNLIPELVHEAGRIAFYGIPPKGEITFRFEAFFRRYATTVSSARAQLEPGLRSFRKALRQIQSGEIDVKPMISHELSLTEITRAFRLAETREQGAVKIVLRLGG